MIAIAEAKSIPTVPDEFSEDWIEEQEPTKSEPRTEREPASDVEADRLDQAEVLTFSTPSRMLVKRSLSPDGELDSVMIEIHLAIDGLSDQTIKERGLKALRLESEIAREYLGSIKSGLAPAAVRQNTDAAQRSEEPEVGSSPLDAVLLDMGKARGNSYFVNVKVAGRTVKLFGTAHQLVAHITRTGHNLTPEAVSDGLTLNWACRATVKPSGNGKYLNIIQLFPAE